MDAAHSEGINITGYYPSLGDSARHGGMVMLDLSLIARRSERSPNRTTLDKHSLPDLRDLCLAHQTLHPMLARVVVSSEHLETANVVERRRADSNSVAYGSVRIVPLIASPMTTLAPNKYLTHDCSLSLMTATTKNGISISHAPIITISMRMDRPDIGGSIWLAGKEREDRDQPSCTAPSTA